MNINIAADYNHEILIEIYYGTKVTVREDNCVIVALLGLGEDSWFLVRNHLLKEIEQLCDEYIDLLGGINKYEQLKWSLLVDGLFMYNYYCYNID